MRNRYAIIGAIAWCGLLIAGWLGIRSQLQGSGMNAARLGTDIGRWLAGTRSELPAESRELVLLAPGDPIFLKREDGTWRQVGFVRDAFGTTSPEAWTHRAQIVIDKDTVGSIPAGFQLEYHATSTSLDNVVRTLLPSERQQQISQMIAADWELHRKELVDRVQPLVDGTLQIAVKEIEQALPLAVQKRRAEFGLLADRYQAEILKGQILPLVQQEILPIIEEETRPLARELGRELWNRVSVWAFTWRFLYDVSPLPERNAVQKEFDRFLAEEVRPVMEARSPDFVAVIERALTRISSNQRVRDVIASNLRTVASDTELHGIIWSIVHESIIANQPLRNALRQYWTSAEVQSTIHLASSRFEPTARKIGDLIFGSREGGVTPEFARVLRTQILLKDRRWLVVRPKAETVPTDANRMQPVAIITATTPMDFPLEFRGNEQSPLTVTIPPPEAP